MKTFFRATMLIILTLTLTTCATAQAGNATTGTGATTAAQLAAALNAMNEGSARASGDTVTLTRNVGVQGNLTVPAGVTLELTGDSGIWIQRDNVTLTVNGTVNTPSNRIGFDSGSSARTMIINGNGTINLTGKGHLLVIGEGRKLTLDGVTLVGIADNNQPLVGAYDGGELVMVSGAITGNSRTSDEWASGGGVEVGNGGTFTLSGGVISGNSARESGGGVHINNATFIMSGGTISGNSVIGDRTHGSSGGGVGVNDGGTFTMSGGTITDNSAYNGGGVRLGWEKGTFTMTGGAITGNTARESGGGISMWYGATSIMEGGEISGNSAGYGGGIDVNEGTTFTMKGGTISGNTAGGGGGVSSSGGSIFSMEGGAISGNSATQQGGGVSLSIKGVNFTMKGGTIYGASAQGGNANTAPNGAAISNETTARWGTGGTYTRGGVNQSGGGNIASTNDTLIAIPAR